MGIPLVQAREDSDLSHGGTKEDVENWMSLYFSGISNRIVEILEGGIDNGTLLSQ